MTWITRFLGIALAVVALLSVQGAWAQESATPVSEATVTEATPVPSDLTAWAVSDTTRPSPELCTAEPASTDELSAAILELESGSSVTTTSNGIVAIPATGPAPQEAIDGVLETLTQFWACNNAGNRASLVAVMTPRGVAELYELDLTADETTVRAAVAAALTPGEPRPAEELAGIDGVISVVTLEDGRIAALVLNTDPRIAGGASVQDLFTFETASGQYLIDGFTGDPFDAIDGYGFDGE